MKLEIIQHESGELLPLILDNDGLPNPSLNEFIISRRGKGFGTMVRNSRELIIFNTWLDKLNINLNSRIESHDYFTEAEIKGSLVEFLRLNHEKRTKVKKLVVKPDTFNQRLITVRQYLSWYFNILIGSIPRKSDGHTLLTENKSRTLELLESSFINSPPTNKSVRKALNLKEVDFLVSVLNPENNNTFGRDPNVRYRNYISTMIMLYYGLRPGELLSLRVSDIEIGAISSIRVERRPPDPMDTRKPRPHIKRNGRILPIEDPLFAKSLDIYITEYRDLLEDASDSESDYLILSDDGIPLSQSSITQFFQLVRAKYKYDLPTHLTAKALRHTFSIEMERILRNSGMDEDKRKKALALLRGDSSLSSQDAYLGQEVEEQANKALKKYQQDLIMEDIPW
jgi:integrase